MRAGRWWMVTSISIYLVGEDKSTKNVPTTTESTIINVNIEHPDDGNVLIARQISDI